MTIDLAAELILYGAVFGSLIGFVMWFVFKVFKNFDQGKYNAEQDCEAGPPDGGSGSRPGFRRKGWNSPKSW